MRCVAFSPPLVLVLVVLLSLVSGCVGSANFTLYQDSSCSTPVGQPTGLPFSSSADCQPVPDQSASYVFYCGADSAGNTNFSFSVWNSTTDCSGDAAVSITSDAAPGSCALTTLTSEGQSYSLYAKIACSSSALQQQRDADALQTALDSTVRAASDWLEMRRARLLRLRGGRHARLDSDNGILALLLGRK